jgi:hypothetical protein
MVNLHHKSIKIFKLEGIIKDDSAIGRLRLEYLRMLTAEMRETGYALRLDIDPDFTIQYNSSKEYFEFKLSVYGTYIGRKKSKWAVGIDGTVVFIQQSRSSESSRVRV